MGGDHAEPVQLCGDGTSVAMAGQVNDIGMGYLQIGADKQDRSKKTVAFGSPTQTGAIMGRAQASDSLKPVGIKNPGMGRAIAISFLQGQNVRAQRGQIALYRAYNTPGVDAPVLTFRAVNVPADTGKVIAFQSRSGMAGQGGCLSRPMQKCSWRVRPSPYRLQYSRYSTDPENTMRPFFRTSLAAAVTTAQIASAAPAQYELDPDHTTVMFTVDHVGYAATLGVFGTVEGSFVYDMETQSLSDVSVTIQADSVNTFHEARDGHVRNQDFLHVGEHPQITFTASSGTPEGETSGTVTGDLTILGQTRPVTLSVQLNKAAEYPFGHKRFVLGLSLQGEINRSDFGMNYAVDNGLVGDAVAIRVETEAMRME